MHTAHEMRSRIIDKAGHDPDYRAKLLADPNVAVGEELGVSIPARLSIHVHEEDSATAHLVLPPSSSLSDADLGVVAAAGSIAIHMHKEQPSEHSTSPADW